MKEMLTQWSVSATMRGIAGLSLAIFLSVIAMNYQAIGQVHAIGGEAARQALSFMEHWRTISHLGVEVELIRLSYLMTPDAAGEKKMQATLHHLQQQLRQRPNSLSEQAEAMVATYGQRFDSLISLVKQYQHLNTQLSQERETLEIVIYEQGDAAMEAAVIDLEPNEVRYLAQPDKVNENTVKMALDRLTRDVSGNEREAEILQDSRKYRSRFLEMVALEQQKSVLVGQLEETAKQMSLLMQKVNKMGEADAEAAYQKSEARVENAQRNALVWTAMGVLLPMLLTFLFDHFFRQRIKILVHGFHQMAQGNLSQVINADGGDEIALLAQAANEMRGHLHELVAHVEKNAAIVHTAAEEISEAANNQAANTSEISASVVEIGSTMEELSSSSSQIAEYAQSVAQIANRTWENSKAGAAAMQFMVGRMSDIRTNNQKSMDEILILGSKSKEITRIMEIINNVADQTRLIAFNAALEASSAGESGRRFGVVAVEIRRLADSVTESTIEIEKKVSEIQNAISRLVLTSEKGATGIMAGMEEASRTATRLGELVDDAHQTNNSAEQISISSQQQKIANSQVVIALREIVTGSRSAAQSVEHISSISQDMVQLSAELNQLVGQFKLQIATQAGKH